MPDALAILAMFASLAAFMLGTLTLFVGGVALGIPLCALIGGISSLLGALGCLILFHF